MAQPILMPCAHDLEDFPFDASVERGAAHGPRVGGRAPALDTLNLLPAGIAQDVCA